MDVITFVLLCTSFVLNFFHVNADIAIKSFKECSDMELATDLGFAYMKSVYYNNSIYLFGGQKSDLTFDNSIRTYPVDKASCYQTSNTTYSTTDDNTASWRTIQSASRGFTGFYEAEYASNENAVYIFGTSGYNNPVWKYSFDTNILNEATGLNLPTLADNYCTTYDSTRNLIYILGGFTHDGSSFHFVESNTFLQIFNVTTETFLDNGDFMQHGFVQLNNNSGSGGGDISTRGYGQCMYDDISDSIYYFTGTSSEFVGLKSVLIYDIGKGKWSELEDELNEFRVYPEVVKIDRQMWVIGGAELFPNSTELNTIEIFDLDSQISNYAKYDNEPVLLSSKRWAVSGMLFVTCRFVGMIDCRVLLCFWICLLSYQTTRKMRSLHFIFRSFFVCFFVCFVFLPA